MSNCSWFYNWCVSQPKEQTELDSQKQSNVKFTRAFKRNQFNKSRSYHPTTGNDFRHEVPKVKTNITINQYFNNKSIEEEKISKMINDSIKSIAKIIENSSKHKFEQKDDYCNPNSNKKIKGIKRKDLKNRPPRQKMRKWWSKNKKHKTESIVSIEEKKESLPDINLNVDDWQADIYDPFNTFLDAPVNKLNLTDPMICSKDVVKNQKLTMPRFSKVSHPRLTLSWDHKRMTLLKVGQIRKSLLNMAII